MDEDGNRGGTRTSPLICEGRGNTATCRGLGHITEGRSWLEEGQKAGTFCLIKFHEEESTYSYMHFYIYTSIMISGSHQLLFVDVHFQQKEPQATARVPCLRNRPRHLRGRGT